MAEIQSQQLQQKNGVGQRCKKSPTRIDLTPMVDLGFLLITFFVFTTSLSQARAMGLVLPDEHTPSKNMPITASKVLTLILADENTVGYYYGDDVSHIQFTSYGAAGLRKVILDKQAAVTKLYKDPQQMMVLIKPSDKSTYKNLVETMVEMLISDVKSYMLLDVTPVEQNLIKTGK